MDLGISGGMEEDDEGVWWEGLLLLEVGGVGTLLRLILEISLEGSE